MIILDLEVAVHQPGIAITVIELHRRRAAIGNDDTTDAGGGVLNNRPILGDGAGGCVVGGILRQVHGLDGIGTHRQFDVLAIHDLRMGHRLHFLAGGIEDRVAHTTVVNSARRIGDDRLKVQSALFLHIGRVERRCRRTVLGQRNLNLIICRIISPRVVTRHNGFDSLHDGIVAGCNVGDCKATGAELLVVDENGLLLSVGPRVVDVILRIEGFIKENGSWSGSATELLALMDDHTVAPNKLMQHITTYYYEVLYPSGISYEQKREAGIRRITFTYDPAKDATLQDGSGDDDSDGSDDTILHPYHSLPSGSAAYASEVANTCV